MFIKRTKDLIRLTWKAVVLTFELMRCLFNRLLKPKSYKELLTLDFTQYKMFLANYFAIVGLYFKLHFLLHIYKYYKYIILSIKTLGLYLLIDAEIISIFIYLYYSIYSSCVAAYISPLKESMSTVTFFYDKYIVMIVSVNFVVLSLFIPLLLKYASQKKSKWYNPTFFRLIARHISITGFVLFSTITSLFIYAQMYHLFMLTDTNELIKRGIRVLILFLTFGMYSSIYNTLLNILFIGSLAMRRDLKNYILIKEDMYLHKRKIRINRRLK